MTTRKEAIEACLQPGLCYEDYPFHDVNWTVMRHNGSGKSFALIYSRNGKMYVNLKATPQAVVYLSQTYEQITVGYHMNKRHWISVLLDGTLDEKVINKLIADSYAITDKPIAVRKTSR